MSEAGFKVHYIDIDISEDPDNAFRNLVYGHSVSLEPAIGADTSSRAGLDFGKFLLEYGDPVFVAVVADVLAHGDAVGRDSLRG